MTRFSKPAARLRTLPPPLCECDGCAELSPHRSGARNGRIGWLMCTVPQIIFSHWLGPQLGTRSPITELVWHTGHRNLCGDEVESHLSPIIWSREQHRVGLRGYKLRLGKHFMRQCMMIHFPISKYIPFQVEFVLIPSTAWKLCLFDCVTRSVAPWARFILIVCLNSGPPPPPAPNSARVSLKSLFRLHLQSISPLIARDGPSPAVSALPEYKWPILIAILQAGPKQGN